MQPKNREIRCDPLLSLSFETQSKHDDAVRADDAYAYFYVYVYGCDVRLVRAISNGSVVSIVPYRVGACWDQYILSSMALLSTVKPVETSGRPFQRFHEFHLS